ncbi:NAD(P)/FAD-dependent oxidoreductase [Paenibacillus hamazuiensis]|uniref:NAD(P)/FAD-dependent oxidoreductase n=1 Tax=Paenibacillus hamazuiensis TaxID=2936508 RepID=UPI00200EC5AC|nr:FAD-dependent oxidoreductase [Paenibacillus hamazuiensis]
MHKCIIIGAGTAGLTAAIYLARANTQPLVITGLGTSTHLKASMELDSFPGFPKGVKGPELLDNMRKQAERFGAELRSGRVSKVDLSSRPYTVWLESGAALQCETVIVSTGVSPNYLGIPGEKPFIGRGVYSCATCSGFFFEDKQLIVVGSGNAALEEAGYLSRFARQVTLVNPAAEFQANPRLLERSRANSKIRFELECTPVEVIGGDRGVAGLNVNRHGRPTPDTIPADAIFAAVGVTPNTQFLEGQLPVDEAGYLLVGPGTTETSIPGVFACGDVQDPKYRQPVTAAGSGCMAALDCERYLEGNGRA